MKNQLSGVPKLIFLSLDFFHVLLNSNSSKHERKKLIKCLVLIQGILDSDLTRALARSIFSIEPSQQPSWERTFLIEPSQGKFHEPTRMPSQVRQKQPSQAESPSRANMDLTYFSYNLFNVLCLESRSYRCLDTKHFPFSDFHKKYYFFRFSGKRNRKNKTQAETSFVSYVKFSEKGSNWSSHG